MRFTTEDSGLKGHINIRILQTMVSGIPLGPECEIPPVYVALQAPVSGLACEVEEELRQNCSGALELKSWPAHDMLQQHTDLNVVTNPMLTPIQLLY